MNELQLGIASVVLLIIAIVILLWGVNSLLKEFLQVKDAIALTQNTMNQEAVKGEEIREKSTQTLENARTQWKALAANLEQALESGFREERQNLDSRLLDSYRMLNDTLQEWRETSQSQWEGTQQEYKDQIQQLDQKVAEVLQNLQESLETQLNTQGSRLQEDFTALQQGLTEAHKYQQENTTEQLAQLSSNTQSQLQSVSEQITAHLHDVNGLVEDKLGKGFAHTNTIIDNVSQKLAVINETQANITTLAKDVESLQTVLTSAQARNAFGEVQLSQLLHDTLPEQSYSLRHTLASGVTADAVIHLPEPSGNLAIDASLSLETYRALLDSGDRNNGHAEAFRSQLMAHMESTAKNLIVPGETAENAILFIPSEAMFAEIHAHHQDLVEAGHRLHVWLTSPTTLFAVMHSARAILKDADTRQQIAQIKEDIDSLGSEFLGYQNNLNQLSGQMQALQSEMDHANGAAKALATRFATIRDDSTRIEAHSGIVPKETIHIQPPGKLS